MILNNLLCIFLFQSISNIDRKLIQNICIVVDISGSIDTVLRELPKLTSPFIVWFRFGRKQQETAKWRPWTIVRRYLLDKRGPHGPRTCLYRLKVVRVNPKF